MNKNIIYKAVFEEIKESLDFACDTKDEHYAWYIDGVISFANRMLKETDGGNEK